MKPHGKNWTLYPRSINCSQSVSDFGPALKLKFKLVIYYNRTIFPRCRTKKFFHGVSRCARIDSSSYDNVVQGKKEDEKRTSIIACLVCSSEHSGH
jgi:hypothetical protein